MSHHYSGPNIGFPRGDVRFDYFHRHAHASFGIAGNVFELTLQAGERQRGGESGSHKEMSHPRRRLTASCVFNNHRRSVN
jgi:hypothetical protein